MALDILHDNWGPYTHTEVENALKAYLSGLEDRINQAIQSGGVGLNDLSQEVLDLLDKADKALQSGDIAEWAKAQDKPGYTVSEITGVEGFQNLLAKLQDMDAKIQSAAQSGEIPDDEMSSTSEKPVQNKVIKAYVDGLIQGLQNVLNTITQDGATQGVIDTFNEVKAFLEGISSSDTLAAKLALLVPKSRTINGKTLGSNIEIGINDIQGLATALANAGGANVSVETDEQGVITINAGTDSYVIDLKHTHEAMAKLRLYTQATMPQVKALDTIYAQVDNVSMPTDIEKLFIAGLEFERGVIPDAGQPYMLSPTNGVNLNLGYNDGSGVSQQINVRGKNLTGALTLSVSNGLSLTYDGTTSDSVTIPMAAALTGALVTIAFSGSGSLADGTLIVTHGANDDVLSQVNVVVEGDVQLKAVKLTGTQWMQTDWNLTANTDIVMKVKFTANANSDNTQSTENWYVLAEPWPSDATNKFYVMLKHNDSSTYRFGIQIKSGTTVLCDVPKAKSQEDESVITLLHTGAFSFVTGESNTSYSASSVAMKAINSPINIGALLSEANPDRVPTPFSKFVLTIYEITISENGTNKRHYLPYRVDGVVGMLDEVTGHFMSSKTDSELVAVELTNNN